VWAYQGFIQGAEDFLVDVFEGVFYQSQHTVGFNYFLVDVIAEF
jgi:hypothetical protein